MDNTTTSFAGIIPANYDNYLGTLFFENFAKDIVDRVKGMKADKILEIAAGTGRATRYLAEIFPNSKIMATDLNPDMLTVGKEKVKNKNIEWKQVDMLDVPFEDNSFDLIVCQFGIMFVPDKQKAIKEMYRVLKPGGTVIMNSWDSMDNNPVALMTHEAVNKFFKDDPVLFYQVPFSYFDENEIRNNLEAAGFKNVSITLVKYIGFNDSIDNSVTGLVEGNPVYVSIKEKNLALLPEIKKELRKILSEKFGEINPKFPLQAWISRADKL